MYYIKINDANDSDWFWVDIDSGQPLSFESLGDALAFCDRQPPTPLLSVVESLPPAGTGGFNIHYEHSGHPDKLWRDCGELPAWWPTQALAETYMRSRSFTYADRMRVVPAGKPEPEKPTGFNILRVHGKTCWPGYPNNPDRPDDEHMWFATGPEAAAMCERLKEEYPGNMFRPQPVRPEAAIDWRDRERKRITDGTYARPAYLDVLEYTADHFLHLAEKRPGQLAYTKDDQKGERDQQSIITLQGYIEAFCKHMEPRMLAEIKAEHNGKEFDDGIKFATKPGEIAAVYTNYSDSHKQVYESCMRYARADFEWETPPVHPTSVYGAGDLAVAYTINEDGETTARTLCWPDKKIYSRVYANDDGYLHRRMKARGYQKSSGYYGTSNEHAGSSRDVDDDDPSFDGARLLRVTHDEHDSIYVVPYCDDVQYAEDDGRFLRLRKCYPDDHHINMRQIEGWSENPCDPCDDDYSSRCERCDCHTDEDDFCAVYTSRLRTAGWCMDCVERASFTCERTGIRYSGEHVTSVSVGDGDETWSQYAFDRSGGTCARTGRRYSADDLTEVIVDERGSTEMWGPRPVAWDTWNCDKTGELVSDDVDKVIVTVDGQRFAWAPHVAELHARGQAIVVYRVQPKLSLTGDDPGQMRLPLDGRRIDVSSYVIDTAA